MTYPDLCPKCFKQPEQQEYTDYAEVWCSWCKVLAKDYTVEQAIANWNKGKFSLW